MSPDDKRVSRAPGDPLPAHVIAAAKEVGHAAGDAALAAVQGAYDAGDGRGRREGWRLGWKSGVRHFHGRIHALLAAVQARLEAGAEGLGPETAEGLVETFRGASRERGMAPELLGYFCGANEAMLDFTLKLQREWERFESAEPPEEPEESA